LVDVSKYFQDEGKDLQVHMLVCSYTLETILSPKDS